MSQDRNIFYSKMQTGVLPWKYRYPAQTLGVGVSHGIGAKPLKVTWL